ncbi:hypothetical protein AAG906_011087 [Vitis piasezkii]
MGFPHSGKKLIVDKGTVKASQMPSLKNIESMMVDINDIEEFKRVFLIFACATLLAPTSRLEDSHSLWRKDNVWIKGCLMFLQLELEMLGGFGKVELVSTLAEQDQIERNEAPIVDDPDETEDFDVICARMEATRRQIIDAQSHVNILIASYNRDMNMLRTHFTSSQYRTDEGQPSSSHEHVNESGAPFDTNNAQHSPVHSGGQRRFFEDDLGCTDEGVSKRPNPQKK